MAIMNSMLPIFLILILKFQFHILTLESFLFCLSWNTNSWDFVKRNSNILSTSTPFLKPLFLCFQETDNDINDARYPCKVTLSNYKYFQKRMDPNTPLQRFISWALCLMSSSLKIIPTLILFF